MKNEIFGINYIDIYFCIGFYLLLKFEVLGREVVGIVVVFGLKMEEFNFKVGDRVIWFVNVGYVEYFVVLVVKIFKLLDIVFYEDVIVSFMSGLIVLVFVREIYIV